MLALFFLVLGAVGIQHQRDHWLKITVSSGIIISNGFDVGLLFFCNFSFGEAKEKLAPVGL